MENPLVANADVVFYLAAFVDDQQYLFIASVSTIPGTRRGGSVLSIPGSLLPIPWYPSCWRTSRSAWSSEGRSATAKVGRLDLLQFARAYGCPWSIRYTAKLHRRGVLTSWHEHGRTAVPWRGKLTMQLLVRGS